MSNRSRKKRQQRAALKLPPKVQREPMVKREERTPLDPLVTPAITPLPGEEQHQNNSLLMRAGRAVFPSGLTENVNLWMSTILVLALFAGAYLWLVP